MWLIHISKVIDVFMQKYSGKFQIATKIIPGYMEMAKWLFICARKIVEVIILTILGSKLRYLEKFKIFTENRKKKVFLCIKVCCIYNPDSVFRAS